MAPTLDVIIVNWNTVNQLHDCLEALSQAQHEQYALRRIIVVDNASTDASAIGLSFPGLPLLIIQNSTNRGFAAACNQGAEGSDADYLLFLNPDTKVKHNTLSESIQWMECPENARTGILGVQLLDENGHIVRSCARFLATRHFIYGMFGLTRLFPRVFSDYRYLDWDHRESRTIEHVTGACCLIRNAIFRDVHGFDERFFVYFEDVDLSLRTWQAGWTSYYLASVQCYHVGGGTSEQIKARRLYYSLQSRILYGFKNFRSPKAVGLLLATLFIEPLSRIADSCICLSPGRMWETLQGYWLLWRALPHILRIAKHK